MEINIKNTSLIRTNVENTGLKVDVGTSSILPELIDLEVTPRSEKQVFKHEGSYGYDEVTVNAIPEEYIIPTGELQISKNGVHNVKEYNNAVVEVIPNLQYKEVIPSGVYQTILPDEEYDGLSRVDVQEVTSNIDHNITPNNIKKGVSILGVDGEYEGEQTKYAPRFISFYMYQGTELDDELENLDVSNIDDMRRMFFSCKTLTRLDLTNFITSKVTNTEYMFYLCGALSSLNLTGCDFSNSTTISNTFNSCQKITYLPEMNGGKIAVLTNSFKDCRSLKHFNGFKDLGKAFLTNVSINYSNYKWDLSSCTLLTHDSLVNIINNLYDIKTKGCNAQQLVLGSNNLAKLLDTEIEIATNKGWTVT